MNDVSYLRGMIHAFILISLVVLLTGCVTTTDAPSACTCVGPYDLGLNSHREALLRSTAP